MTKGEGNDPDQALTVIADSPLINKYSQIYEDVVGQWPRRQGWSSLENTARYFRTNSCAMLEDSIEIDVIGQSDVPVRVWCREFLHEYYDLMCGKKITKHTYLDG